MSTDDSFLHSVIRRFRVEAESSESEGKFSDDYIMRDMMPQAISTIHNLISKDMDNPVYMRHKFTVEEGKRYYPLPAGVRSIARIVRENDDLRQYQEIESTTIHSWHQSGWSIEGNEINIHPNSFITIGEWTLIYRASGEYRPHYSANGLSLDNDGQSATLDTTPSLGALDKRDNVYAGWMLRIFSNGANFTQERLIESSSMSGGAISVKTRTPFDGFTGQDLTYEVVPPGFESLMDAITQELLLREAVITRKARSHVIHLQKMRSSAIKVITDILATMNEKDGKRYTVDTPNALRDIYWTIGSGY